MCQSNNCEQSQLGRRLQVLGVPGRPLSGSRWEGSGGKARLSSGWYQRFYTHAGVGKSSSEWKGHCSSWAAESAAVCLVSQRRVFPRNLRLRGISQRLVRHRVCWAAEQDKFKSCLSLNWYLGLSWAARDDGCSPFWFCFAQVMTLCPWLLFAAVACQCPRSVWADCSRTQKTGKGWASIITAWQGLRIRPGTWNQFELHYWITDVAHCPC